MAASILNSPIVIIIIAAAAVHFTGIYDLKKLGPEIKKLFNKAPAAAPPKTTPPKTTPPAEEEPTDGEEEPTDEEEEPTDEEEEEESSLARAYLLTRTPEFHTYHRIPAGLRQYT